MGKYLNIALKNTSTQCEKSEKSEKRVTTDADELFEERAAIMEYDGNLSRQDAENEAGELIGHGLFKSEFNNLAAYLKAHHYSPDAMSQLQKQAYLMDEAWNGMDYPKFRAAINRMMSVPGVLQNEQ